MSGHVTIKSMTTAKTFYTVLGAMEFHRDANGQPHSLTGPAIVFSSGRKDWYMHGKRHRVGGPAIIYSEDDVEWFIDGQLHRDGGPARESPQCLEWYRHGVPHRIDGPAFDCVIRGQRWYVNGRRFMEHEFYKYVDTFTGDVLIPPGRTLVHD